MRWVWLLLCGLGAACRGAAPEWALRGDTAAEDGAAGEGPRFTPPASGDAEPSDARAEASAAGASTGAEDDALEQAAGCGAEHITSEEAHGGNVRAKVPVAVGPLVASSQKFLVSEAQSGSCLWGAFAADPERGGPGSGLFLVSFGAPHAEGEACRAGGTDGLPDDLAPGDLLEVEGRLETYAPAACSGTAPALQLRIDAACPARRIGTAPLPAPTLIEPSLADELALGRNVELLRAWGGVLVRLRDVSAEQDAEDGDAVGPYGVIRLNETRLEVHSRLGFFDLSAAGPRDPAKAPRFGYPLTFRSVTGLVFLDYCTWALGPRESCHDLSPPSQQCSPAIAPP